LTGPAGIQSMNVGIKEAKSLANKITGILKNEKPLEDLESYATEQMMEWRFLLGMEGGLKPQENADEWIGQCCDRLIPCLPVSGNDLLSLTKQVSLDKVTA